ncbi:MAG: hypothetical protein JNM17_27255 [Archangium sp.]|nr:hypothetical protein [Archangium sp.]
MRTTLLIAALVMGGCGVSEAQLDETAGDVTSEEGELGTSSRTYVVARRDYRKCAFPMCSGWFIHDVNRAELREVYVPRFDFSASNLHTDEQQQLVKSAPDNEVVLYGKLGVLKNGYRDFMVTTAWRGMPGVKFTEGSDTFFRVAQVNIQCFAAPCATMQTTRLHSTSKTYFHDLSVERASMPNVDQNWMTFRITDKDALVAGKFVDGAQVGAGREKVLDAAQVFVKLPDMTQSCGRTSAPLCSPSKVNTFVRDENRCVMPAGCVTPGACAAVVPACAEGYSLVSWTGGSRACTQHVCDPSWLLE